MASSPDSLLRLVRQAQSPAKKAASIVGSDDWAYKRRLRSGTIICDLETRKPLDLLPDRSVQTVCTWLEQHREVAIMSRDRWSEYATAAQKGAPQALQVADRWHLLHNLVEHLTHLLARQHSHVRQQSAIGLQDKPQAVSAPVAQRQDQYRQIPALHQLGLAPGQIARRVGLSERTVSRWLAKLAAPHGRHAAGSASVIDPYQASVLKRWQEGCRKGSHLCQELKAQGSRGSQRAVYRSLSFLQETLLPAELAATSTAGQPAAFWAKQAVWWLIRQPEELDEQQRQALTSIRQARPEIEKAYQLAQSFRSMLRQRQGKERLDGWLQEARQSGLPE
jgi:transposase